jgi:hypothetical protein
MRIVQVEQPKERVVRRLAVINEQANEMKKLASELEPGEFLANIGACHSYGQLCSYHMANGGPCNPFGEVEVNCMASLADRIKAKKLTPEMMFGEEQPSEPLKTLVPETVDAPKEEPTPAVNLIPPTTVVSQPKMSPMQAVETVAAIVEEGVLDVATGSQVLDSKGTVLAEVKEAKKRGRPPGSGTKESSGLQDIVKLALETLGKGVSKVTLSSDGHSVSVEK